MSPLFDDIPSPIRDMPTLQWMSEQLGVVISVGIILKLPAQVRVGRLKSDLNVCQHLSRCEIGSS